MNEQHVYGSWVEPIEKDSGAARCHCQARVIPGFDNVPAMSA